MKNFRYFILILIWIVCCFYGCKSYESCSSLGPWKAKLKDVSNVINGGYFLCYIEEDPINCIIDSSLKKTFPTRLKNRKNGELPYTLIKLKVKPVDMYFTKYSREGILEVWGIYYYGSLHKDEAASYIPIKDEELNFNILYYVTCNSSEIEFFRRLYSKKELVLLDNELPGTKVDYYYCFNGYPANKIDFSKLYSFDEVVKDFKKEMVKDK